MNIPRHPAGELESGVFHATLAGIGVAHVVTGIRSSSPALAAAHITGGLLMIWFHATGAKRHFEAIGE